MPDSRPGLVLDADGFCSACLWHRSKASIDWSSREAELRRIADWARETSEAPWHCVVGVSGGKDSTWQALYVRECLGLNPLLVQYVGSDGTGLGRRNIENLVRLGFSLHSVQPDPVVARKLSLISFRKFGNLVKYSDTALFPVPFRAAIAYQIPLVFFGENPALEAGDKNLSDRPWDASTIVHNNTLSGQSIEIWLEDGIEKRDLIPYAFPSETEFRLWGGKAVFMGYYLNWSGYRNAVVAIQRGLACHEASPCDMGIPYHHNCLDSDNGGIVNSMLKHVKLGFGNATEFLSYDLRQGRISRPDAIRLVKDLDGRCHPRFIEAYCRWVGISVEEFHRIADSFRGPMWERDGRNDWRLIDPIWEQEPYSRDLDVEALLARLDTRRVAREVGPLPVYDPACAIGRA